MLAPSPPPDAALLQRLQKLERRCRRDEMAMQVSNMGTWTRDMRTEVVEWSPELIKIFGLEEETYPRTNDAFFELVHPEDQAQFAAAIAGTIADHSDYDVQFRYRHASGEYRWMCGRGRCFYDANGCVTELAGIGLEITAQRQAEEALRNRELQLRQIGDNLPDGALYQVVGDASGARRFVYWSAGIERLIGVPAEEALRSPESLYSLIHPEDIPLVATAEERSFLEQCIFQVEMRIRHRATGEWRWVQLCSAPRLLPDGSTVWDGIYFDITRSKHVEDALNRSMERLDLAQRAGHIGVFDWNVQTSAIVWSAEEERIFGLEPGTFGGNIEAWAKCVAPCDLAAIQLDLNDAMVRREDDVNFAYRIVRPDGAVRWIEGAGRCFYDSAGQPLRMVGVNLDVTERRDNEKSLQEADRRKNEFLAMLGHELRNPLSAIRNALHVCEDAAVENPSLVWAKGVIDRQSQQLSRLVDDLLDVSRITRGKVELRKEVIEAPTVLDRAIEAVRPLLSEKRHELTTSYEPADRLVLEADPARLEQILVNLLANAAKYTDAGGRIWLEARRHEDEVHLAVRDSGIGIEPELVPEMFELFAQGERSLARTEGGLGLGLTIVKSLVELHGGQIQARSEGKGKGSEFIIRLPALKMPNQIATAAPACRAAQPAATTLKILVVDDNVDTAEGMARLLRRKGHQTEIAYEGRTALRIAETFLPDSVLLDLGLPGMDGYEVAMTLRAHAWGAKATIIAISGYGQDEDRRRSQEAGFDHHLVKPADFEEVLELLKRS